MSDDKKKKDKFSAFFAGFSDSEEHLDFRMAHETVGEKLPVIPSGSLALDDALSSGGLPRGRLIQFYGAPGSGKTLMAMLAIKEAQLVDPTAKQVFIDAEQTFSPDWAAVLGLDTTRIIVVDGDTAVNGRKCFEMILGVPKEDAKTHILKGKSKEGLLDNIANGTFNINMIVLDSLGSIIPPGEDISAVGKMNMALLARFLTTTFRKLSLEVNKANVPFIIINHKKANMDPYGVDHTFSGGNTYAHFLSANVYFEAVARADAQILDEKEQKVGHTMRSTIEKSKFGPYPRKCEFRVNFGIGVIDKHEEIAKLAIDYDIIKRPNNVMYELGDQKWRGQDAMFEAIRDDSKLSWLLTNKIAEAREAKWDAKRKEQEAKTAAVLSVEAEDEEVVGDEEEPKKSKKGK
jgi:recombination protein RecA